MQIVINLLDYSLFSNKTVNIATKITYVNKAAARVAVYFFSNQTRIEGNKLIHQIFVIVIINQSELLFTIHMNVNKNNSIEM